MCSENVKETVEEKNKPAETAAEATVETAEAKTEPKASEDDNSVSLPSASNANSASVDTTTAIKKSKRKSKLNVPQIVVYISATFNNTIVTITKPEGDVIAWDSAGECGFKGARKSTPHAAKITTETAVRKAKLVGAKMAIVKVCGAGTGRESAIRAIGEEGIEITVIEDISRIPFNGPKPKKSRRV